VVTLQTRKEDSGTLIVLLSLIFLMLLGIKKVMSLNEESYLSVILTMVLELYFLIYYLVRKRPWPIRVLYPISLCILIKVTLYILVLISKAKGVDPVHLVVLGKLVSILTVVSRVCWSKIFMY
jgi:hypothetical protein